MTEPTKNKEESKELGEDKMTQNAFDDAVIAWVAPEAIRHERGKVWKMVMLAIIIGFVVWGIMSQALTFSIAVIVFAVVYYFVGMNSPKDVEVKISQVGIKVGDRRYSYSIVKAFWINYEPPYTKTLNIRIKNNINCDVTIQLNEQNPAPIREFLMKKMPELENQNEKLTDILARIFKI